MADSKNSVAQNVVVNNMKGQVTSKPIKLIVSDGRLVPDDKDLNPGVMQ